MQPISNSQFKNPINSVLTSRDDTNLVRQNFPVIPELEIKEPKNYRRAFANRTDDGEIDDVINSLVDSNRR